MPQNPDSLTSIADISATSANAGEMRCNLGDAITQDGYASEAAIWGTPGFIGRPADPTTTEENGIPAGACQALFVVEGNQKRVIATRDNRVAKVLPQLQPGESMQYGPHAGQFIRCDFDGGISIYTTDDGTKDGHALYVKVSPTNGVDIATPWGRLRVAPDGINATTSGGASLNMGSIQGVPEPLGSILDGAGIDTYATLDAGMVSIKAGILSLGTDGGAGNEAAVLALTTLLQAMHTALLTISTTPAVVGNPVLTPVQAALVTAALASFTPVSQAIGRVV